MKQVKWHFRLSDGKGGIIIRPAPSTRDEVLAECVARFGSRLKEVTAS